MQIPYKFQFSSNKHLSALIRVDPLVYFSWSQGFIIPSENQADPTNSVNKSEYIETQEAGQSISWTGFIVSPRTDDFKIFAHVENVNVTISIDDVPGY